jgi:tetratricopeptide (TPR) repeat protein
MTDRVLRAYYDLAVAPVSHDVCVFLCIAEMERLYRGLDAIELIVVADAADNPANNSPSRLPDEEGWRLRHIVLPAHRLLPSCRRARYMPDRSAAKTEFDPAAPTFPNGYTVDRPVADHLDTGLLLARFANKPWASLRVSPPAVERVTGWLDAHTAGRKPVVITLRQEAAPPQCDSNLPEWCRFARALDADRYCPVFVPDPSSVFTGLPPSLEDFPVFEAAAINLELRLALYEAAYINLHVDSAPTLCCMLDDRTRYIRFRADPESALSMTATSLQHSVPENDDLPVLRRKFAELTERIDADLPATRPQLPTRRDTISYFLARQHFAEAARLADLGLADDPGNLELQFLLATALARSGAPDKAVPLFRELLQMTQAYAVVVVPLADCLWKSGAFGEAVRLMSAAAADGSALPDFLHAIAGQLIRMGEDEKATAVISRVVQERPDNPEPLILLAQGLSRENLHAADALRIVNAALQRWPDRAEFHAIRADCCARHGRFDEAISALSNAMRLTGSHNASTWTILDLTNWVSLAIWKRLIGDEAGALEILEKVIARIDNAVGAKRPNETDRMEYLAIKARLHYLMGRESDARRCYDDILRLHGDRPHDFTSRSSLRPYLPDTPRRLARMEEMVGGRDIFIFCHGPSIAAMDMLWPEFAAFDACIMALNRFAIFEKGFLAQTQRHIDVVAVLNYQMMKAQLDTIIDFLSRKTENLLVTNAHSTERMGSEAPARHDFESTFDERLLYLSEPGPLSSVTPHNPLRFTPGNTLSILIALAVMARPRRLFLFGADGGGDRAKIYYRESQSEFRSVLEKFAKPDIANTHAADSIQFNALAEFDLLAVEQLFGCPRPPIYNVSPSSALTPFPRIGYDEALKLLASEADAPPRITGEMH